MPWDWDGDTPREPFDQDLADSYIGKYILVGITHCTPAGEILSREQLHGVIVSAVPSGITIALKGKRDGQFWIMPPAVELLEAARPGIYTLHSTGEKIEDPDLLATWKFDAPQSS